MKKIWSIVFVAGIAIFYWMAGPSLAQSTLEYGALTSATTAAAKKAAGAGKSGGSQEGEGAGGMMAGAMQGMYGESTAVMSKGSALLGQVGGGVAPAALPAASASSSEGAPSAPPGKESAPRQEASATPAVSSQEGVDSVTIHLRGGQTVTGRPLEHTKEYLKILCEGVEVTYFMDEIERIEVGAR